MRYLYLLLMLAITGVEPAVVVLATPEKPTPTFNAVERRGGSAKVPLPSPSLPSCNDMHSKNWVSRDAMTGAILSFCNDAARKYTPSDNDFDFSEGVTYQSSNFKMSLHIPAMYEFTEDDCVCKMNMIQNKCDNNPSGNPMGWKYGGKLDAGSANFVISVPDERYVSGRCHLHLREFWSHNYKSYKNPNSGFTVNCMLLDASGTKIYDTGPDARIKVADGYTAAMPAPTLAPAYYNHLLITNNYLKDNRALNFSLGSQWWLSSTQSADQVGPWCNVGLEDHENTNVYHDMDCWMPC